MSACTAALAQRLMVEGVATTLARFREGAVETILASTAIFPDPSGRIEITGGLRRSGSAVPHSAP